VEADAISWSTAEWSQTLSHLWRRVRPSIGLEAIRIRIDGRVPMCGVRGNRDLDPGGHVFSANVLPGGDAWERDRNGTAQSEDLIHHIVQKGLKGELAGPHVRKETVSYELVCGVEVREDMCVWKCFADFLNESIFDCRATIDFVQKVAQGTQ